MSSQSLAEDTESSNLQLINQSIKEAKADKNQNPDEINKIIKNLQSIPDDLSSKDWDTIKSQKLEMFVTILSIVSKRLEPMLDANGNFNYGPVPLLDVSPPHETGFPPGIDPNAIKDPALRAKYEADIKANHLVNLAYINNFKWEKQFEILIQDLATYNKYVLSQEESKELKERLGQEIHNPIILNKVTQAVFETK